MPVDPTQHGVDAALGPTAPDDADEAEPRRFPTGLIVVVIAAIVGAIFLAITLPALAVRSPLGHDESVYTLRGRDLLTGWNHLSGDYWRDYRAPGLPMLLGALGQVFGVHVTTSRLVVVLLAMVIMAATAAIGARLSSPLAGLIAAAMLPLVYGFSLTATTVLADTPGAAFALVAVAVYLRDVAAGRLRLSFVAVPLLTLASTLSRFGAPFMLAAGLAAAAVVYAPDAIRRRDWLLAVQSAILAVAVAVVVGLVLLTDLFTLGGQSPADANTALVSKNGFTLGSGLDDLYSVVNPWSGHVFPLWSKAAALVFVGGIVAALISVAVDRSRWRLVTFGLSAGIVSLFCVVATVGLVVPNYLMLTLPYWALAAAAGWEWVAQLVHSAWRERVGLLRAAAIAVLVGFVALAIDAGTDVRHAHHEYERAYANIRTASVVTHDVLGDSCVLIARYTPQAAFYSTCRTAPFEGWDTPDVAEALALSLDHAIEQFDLGVPPDVPVAVMLVERAIRQPDLGELSDRSELFSETIFEAGDPGKFRSHVIVNIADPCVSLRTCDG